MAKLSAKKVSTFSGPGVLFDGEGLYLRAKSATQKSWVLRTTFEGKRIDVGLGSASLFTLAEARDEARRLRKAAKLGEDPRRSKRKETISFEQASRLVFKDVGPTLTNEKARAQWFSTIERYAFPTIGERPIASVRREDVLAVLSPIWVDKAETASRLKQRLKRVFDWAKGAGHYNDENPVLGIEASLPRVKRKVKHHDAMPWRDVPDFMKSLAHREGVSARCLEFLILTGARSGEARGARWAEIDFETAVWTVPAERMKAREEHRVPLCEQALEAAHRVRGLDAELVFPSLTGSKAKKSKVAQELSVNTFKALFIRMERDGFTTHGFRSAFADWARESARADREVAEIALAHSVGNAVERAYARSDLFERRRELMEVWAQFCSGNTAQVIKMAR